MYAGTLLFQIFMIVDTENLEIYVSVSGSLHPSIQRSVRSMRSFRTKNSFLHFSIVVLWIYHLENGTLIQKILLREGWYSDGKDI